MSKVNREQIQELTDTADKICKLLDNYGNLSFSNNGMVKKLTIDELIMLVMTAYPEKFDNELECRAFLRLMTICYMGMSVFNRP